MREEVWRILVEECGALDDLRPQFDAWPDCREFRFIGALGFGGKVWSSRSGSPPYVTCYREDETPERLAMLAKANERLASLPSRG